MVLQSQYGRLFAASVIRSLLSQDEIMQSGKAFLDWQNFSLFDLECKMTEFSRLQVTRVSKQKHN